MMNIYNDLKHTKKLIIEIFMVVTSDTHKELSRNTSANAWAILLLKKRKLHSV